MGVGNEASVSRVLGMISGLREATIHEGAAYSVVVYMLVTSSLPVVSCRVESSAVAPLALR
jgi:hypothetical protein